MDFVSAIDVEGVKELLHRHGADIANHKRQLQLGFSLGYAWDEHGMPWPETDQYQPISPLRMVAFRLSDCCLSLEDLGKFELIARLLIDAGADAVDAASYLHRRYGSTSTGDEDYLEPDHRDVKHLQAAFVKVCRTIESAAGII